MLKQRYLNEALFPYQGPLTVRLRLASNKKSLTRWEKRQHGQTSVRRLMKGGAPCENEISIEQA